MLQSHGFNAKSRPVEITVVHEARSSPDKLRQEYALCCSRHSIRANNRSAFLPNSSAAMATTAGFSQT